MGGQDEADQASFLEYGQGGHHGVFVIGHHRVPIRSLVARRKKRLHGKRILIGSRQVLFDERTNDAAPLCTEPHEPDHTAEGEVGDEVCRALAVALWQTTEHLDQRGCRGDRARERSCIGCDGRLV